jgi:biopolymer transport protein ExbD
VRARRRVETEAGLSITSMMDMFTIILLFLLHFFDPSQEASALVLPHGRATEASPAGRTVHIEPRAVKVDGVPVFGLERGEIPSEVPREGRKILPLRDALSRAGVPEGAVLRIEADRSAPFSVVGDVLYTAGDAGFQQYRFVVVHDG